MLVLAKERKAVREIHEAAVFGSLNQYGYVDHSHDDNPTKNTHRHDRSILVTGIDFTARSRQIKYNSKIVFRNTQTMNLLANGADRDRTQVAYVGVINHDVDYFVRLGRKNGNSVVMCK